MVWLLDEVVFVMCILGLIFGIGCFVGLLVM